jgi:hypothetical protein
MTMSVDPNNTADARFAAAAAAALWAARWDWLRLADQPLHARVTLVADQVWQSAHTIGYQSGYRTVTGQVAAAAEAAAPVGAAARLTLDQLAAAARHATKHSDARPHLPPPADRATLRTAQRIAADTCRSGQPQPWVPVADAVWAAGTRAGVLAGALTAATDVLISWRARGGNANTDRATIEHRPARTWVADLLAGINRDIATAVGPSRDRPYPPIAVPLALPSGPAESNTRSGAGAWPTAPTHPTRSR